MFAGGRSGGERQQWRRRQAVTAAGIGRAIGLETMLMNQAGALHEVKAHSLLKLLGEGGERQLALARRLQHLEGAADVLLSGRHPREHRFVGPARQVLQLSESGLSLYLTEWQCVAVIDESER